ncbi:hypothetical protein V3O24_16205 [Methylobacter sp. Wu8]|uniref:Uncharacterized protein n=1 Tax=Methylobacter tundripaludum TaxID=173365 RepID=A0A2S6H6T4_9GAMM|nr:hypothetical protein [Methylobacter tundripaludum]MCF7964686.1 hypothetical protein [Methylobacter tundripaludum]MCK9636386.1 hypothetical protein [Methylobacter tundripaludum]PPK73106.1 hypothetical protein B0F88_10285 [Methylobacter tundripaludum]
MKQSFQYRQPHTRATLLLMLAAVPIASLADAADIKSDARTAAVSDTEEAESEKKYHKEKHQADHKTTLEKTVLT